jgi:glycosyltransferase involved in cell wall biosynthesis
MRPLRVLTFLHSFEPGGVERVALRLVRQWRDMGFDATLFMGRSDGALRSELAGDLAHDVPARRRWTATLETLWMIWTLPDAILASDPDVLFCAGNTYTIVVIAMKLLLGRRCPPVVAKVSNELTRPGQGKALRLLFAAWGWLQSCFVDSWVVMHPAMRDDVARFHRSTPVAVIPDPALTLSQIDCLRDRRPRNGGPGGRRFVALGRLVPQKNYELLLCAFAAGAGPDDRLTIYGDGDSRSGLERLAGQLGIVENVTFAGHVAHSSACLVGHDTLLMTSHFEGIPATLVEGMTCGMPVVATDCGVGVRALVDDYRGGTLVSRGDVAAFAAAISAQAPGAAPSAPFDAELYTIEGGAVAYADVFQKVRRRSSPALEHDVSIERRDAALDHGLAAQAHGVSSDRAGSV